LNQRVSVVITDLDNTLFDWVDIWYQSFSAMLDRLAQDSKISREQLELEFKAIHQKYGTSEYAFSIEELPSLIAKHPGEDLAKKYEAAIRAFRDARKQALRLYPSVQDTLETLKDKGCLIVGYTESMVFYTSYRMRKLGLDRLLDFLFSPPDHEVPDNIKRFYPPDTYELRRTVSDHTPIGELKPNPRILLQILQKIGAEQSEVVYVGDSLMKDVVMAKQAGVTDVWAKYGAADKRQEYELLRRVTHWTDEAVAREKATKHEDVKPSVVLEKSFGDILQLFQFSRFAGTTPPSPAVIEVWKKAVDVQQHFNDLELRIRNYALTVLGGLFAVIGFAIKEHVYRWGLVGVLVAALVLLYAFYFMDRHWYHRLLLGSVSQGSFIENRYRKSFPEMGLTTAIGISSPADVWWWPGKLRSERRAFLFYLIIASSLLVMLISMVLLIQFAPAQNFTLVPAPQLFVAAPSVTATQPTQLSTSTIQPSQQKLGGTSPPSPLPAR
jgi:FMN phosphatase YigB (HAD superfamily)